ncbi:hypothetical protein DOTSEDRAFT_67418 [Dothistroma septosporum NZE10]|uniref:SnoaL-like domain-containing protein n=1 Tax=Dothistroma septosporum (strain NZE10 / CBS 128990) TaxID=675120 RepID=N1PZ98_DOTSN|nr:hypothetical protein DOTSEDRAFT_67418 [Dothistroma septosporum NZE10]
MAANRDISGNMRKTTEGFLYSWNGDWIHSAEPNLATRAPECQHIMMPASVGASPKSNDDWAEYFKHVAPLITDSKMTIHDYLAVPEDRRAVCRSSMAATTPAGPLNNEYVWFLTFDVTGDKIIRIEEFLDSKATTELRIKLREGGYLKH